MNWIRFYYINKKGLEIETGCKACKRPAATRLYQDLKKRFQSNQDCQGYGYNTLNKYHVDGSPVNHYN